jgi:P-type E1-E2 ATPase
VMEQLGSVTTVAFDKTGTLTVGSPALTDVRPMSGTNLTSDELLVLAAAAELPSEHPLAAAVVAAARQRGLQVPPVEEFDSAPGRGVRAHLNGRRIQVGSPAHLLPAASAAIADRHTAHAMSAAAEMEASGQTAIVVLVDAVPVGVLGLADQLREGAPDVVDELTTLTGHTPVLLTGDNPRAAAALAAQVGITDVRAGLLPEDKVTAVAELERGGAKVLLVGDGVNDAPALAAAHTGIAMGRAGSDLALDTADAVIVRDELATIARVIALSRRARRIVIANLAIAATFITVLVLWDLFGHLPLPLGVAGHEGSTVIVGLNGMRLLSQRAWHRT